MQQHNFIWDLTIILASAFPLIFIGRRIRVPDVVSFLITGIIIGPHAFSLINDVHAVEEIADIGVALILFFIGLHTPLGKLAELGRGALYSGTAQLLLTIFAVAGIAFAIGRDLREGTFYGFMLALSSTAVIVPLISSRDEMGAPFAKRALGVLLYQDFAVFPLVLSVPLFAASGGDAKSVLFKVAVASIGIVAFILIGRKVVPALFHRLARLGRETFTAAAVVMVLGIIALADYAGISAALGAFAAGVVIGDTEYIHEISTILRPFRDFLSVLFFASIGMLLDPSFLIGNALTVLATVTCVVVLKIAVAYPAFRLGRAAPRTALRAAFTVAPVGELAFLLSRAGKGVGILNANDEQMFISIAVLTLASSPLLISAGQTLAKKIRGAQETITEDASAKLQKHIVVVGYGLNGQNVSRILSEMHIPFIVMEEDPDRITAARKVNVPIVFADAADEMSLREVHIERALGIVIAISDPEGTRQIVRQCRAASATVRIIVRTRYVSEVDTLRTLGADEVIPEEFETSIEIVMRLMRLLAVPANIAAAQLRILRDEAYRLLRDPSHRTTEGRRLTAILAGGTSQTFLVLPDSTIEGKTLGELKLEHEHVTVPIILRNGVPLPAPLDPVTLEAGDTLLLVGAHEDLLRVTTKLENA